MDTIDISQNIQDFKQVFESKRPNSGSLWIWHFEK